MTSLAILTLSPQGAAIADHLARHLPGATIYLHDSIPDYPEAKRFSRTADLVASLFPAVRGLILILPTGVAVRAIAPLLQHKTTDPAVVVVDAFARYAISLLSGHEGGANGLAIEVSNLLAAEPVVTTTTDALKDVIVGIGCRRGTPAESILAAIRESLARATVTIDRVRLLASADLKSDEPGLREAARQLNIPVRFIASSEIRQSNRNFDHFDFVQEKVNLPAVAEPAALLAGRRTTLLLPRQVFPGVTIALAQESSSLSA